MLLSNGRFRCPRKSATAASAEQLQPSRPYWTGGTSAHVRRNRHMLVLQLGVWHHTFQGAEEASSKSEFRNVHYVELHPLCMRSPIRGLPGTSPLEADTLNSQSTRRTELIFPLCARCTALWGATPDPAHPTRLIPPQHL